MRRLTAIAVLLAAAILPPAGCKRRSRVHAVPADNDGPVESTINIADPEGGEQLLDGFHSVENNSWRWTTAHFSVTLRPPVESPINGAMLELKGAVPSAVVERLGPISLSATVNGYPLKSEIFSRAGAFAYSREVPASIFTSASALVDFAVDKALPPSGKDARELALVVTSIGLAPIRPN